MGAWAVDYAGREPVKSAFLLLTVAAVKSLVAAGPLLLCRGRRPRRVIRKGAWGCAAVLTVYGAVNSVAAWLVLSGTLDTDAPIDRRAMIGHGYLWDPLFLSWGLLLAAGLYVENRGTRRATVALDEPQPCGKSSPE